MKKNYLSQLTELILELFFDKKYILLLVALTVFSGNLTIAQTAGPSNPGTGNFVAGANIDWTNPGNITNTADTNYATAVFAGAGNTDNLQGSNYGFAIPTGAIINGIEVSVRRMTSATNGGRVTKDNVVSLVKGGVVTGTNKATVTPYTTSFAVATYGSSIDTWGTTWTPANINAANFGAVLSVNVNNSLTATVDYIRITVYYTTIGFSPSNACIGSNASIVITGNYIPGTTAVSVNGTAATFVQNSNTQVTATLPAGATTGTISLTTPQGTGTSVSNFTVNPLPVLAAITGTTSVCIGSTTTLANSTPGGTWNSASTGVATISSSGVVSGLSAGTSLITYTYTNGNGCTNSVTTTVTVNSLPVVSSSATVCVGNTTQLTPNSGGTWISNDITKATVDNTGLVTSIAVGNVTFTYTDSTTNCSKTTNAVTVLALPAITSDPTATQTICSGSAVSFSVSATGAGLSYQWYNGITPLINGGSISGATGTTLTINPVSLSDASANYNCVVSGTCAPAATSANAQLLVIEKVTITSQPVATQTLCTGNTATFAVAATGTGISYQWYKGASALIDSGFISGATTNTLTIFPLVIGDAAANYYCLVSGISPCSAVASSNSNLNINQSPVINTQPQLTQTVCENGSASFSVSAIATGITYQWYNGITSLSNGGSISGATSATLTINPVSLGDASANYYCVVSGTCLSTATSTNAELIIIQKVVINSQPVATQTLCTGGTAIFAIVATGAGISYQWYKGATVLIDSGSISGATTNTLTISPLVISDAAANYYCLVSGTSPCSAVASSNSNLNINQSPVINTQPQLSQTVCESGSVSFSVSAIATGITYQWYDGITPLSNGGSISGATSATLTINPVFLSDTSANYNCVVSGTCSSTATSLNAELLVIQKVIITTQPLATQTLCTGDTATFAVAATGAGVSYQWYKGATALIDGGSISGATTNALTISPMAASDAATNYYCLVSGTSPCSAVASSNAILNVNQSPTVTGQPVATQTVCQDGTVSFSITGAGGSLVYQWYKGATLLSNGGTISGATSATLTINPVALSDAGSDYNCVVSNGCVGTDTSGNAALVVSPKAVIPVQSQSICSQTGFSFTPVDGVPNAGTIVPSNTVYSWSAPSVTGGMTGGAGLSAQTAITGTLNNPTNTNQTATYTITPTSGISPSCPSSSFTLTVTVTPKASIQNTATTICTNGTFTITPTNGSGNSIPSGTLYSWGIPTVTGGITGATAASNQASIVQTLTNPTTIAQTATYTITPLSGSCAGATFTVTVTVNPNPVTAVNFASQNTCSGVAFPTISVTNTNSLITTYAWTRDNTTNVSGTNSGTSAIIASGNSFSLSQTLTNNTTTAQSVIYTFIPTSNGCVGSSITSTIVVSPKAVIPVQSLSTCSQSGFSFTPVDGIPNAGTMVPANTVYSWSAPSVTGGMTGGAGLSGQTAITGTLNNPTNTNQTATYTVTPTSGISPSCAGSSFTVTVTVTPKPSIQNTTTTICTNGTFTITPTNGSGNVVPSGTLYSWGIPSVTGGITGATSGSNQASIVQTLVNPTTTAQTATYTITALSGSCSGSTFTLTVTVNPNPVTSVNFASQNACSGIAFPAIVTTNTNGLATTYAWTRDNNTDVSGTISGTSGTIAAGSSFSLSQILTNNTATTQNVIFTFTPTSNGCVGSPVTSTIVLNASAVGGTASSSLPGVIPVVKTITECHFATGTVYLSGYVGTIVRWEYTTTGGATWLPIVNTAASYTYTNITQSTFFRAVIQNGIGCTLVYSLGTMVNVIPNIKPTPVTATPQTICVGDSSTLYSESGFATSSFIISGGTFSNANPDNWLVDGCGNCLNAGGSNTSAGPFRLSATNGGTYEGINYAAVGKFAIASGNYNSVMQTPIFNTFGLPSATLSFNHAFNLQAGASVSVQLSLDGGATYPVVLTQYSGPSTRTPYNAFPLETIDLSNYIGQANLRIRFVYNGNANSSWAIDNVIIPEAPSNLTTEWVDSSTGLVISNTATAVVSPQVTTTYAITSHLNGCTSFGPDGTTYITITVNQRPTASIGPSQTICNGGTATFSVALTGVAPWSVTYSNGTTTTTVNNVNTNPYVFSVSGITVNRTYTITALSDSKCTAKPQDLSGSAVVTVLNGVVGLWTGLVSTDWFDCKNWAGGLPSATVNAQIPAGAPRMPIIDPSTSTYAALYSNIARAQDIIIANTASVTMATNSDLYISRDWKNNGTFTPGLGTVTFNSSTLNQIQAINLGIKTNETFYNLTLDNTNSAKGISLVDGFQLTVANNLSLLSGDLRLIGEAQIVQNGIAANPSSGTGKILIDQQGNRSSYLYNYWTSPVSSNGTNYSLNGVLRDGTDSATNLWNPAAITFGTGAYFADGAITTPVKLSTRWLYKYTSVSTVYAGWQFVGDTGTISIGEGFTMKGVTGIAPFTTPQNYVFAGKPNNGTIPLSISLNQSYLVGNPYPCALDADEFIKDNIKDGAGRAATNIFNGALYFWDHFGGQTHILNEYIGGYASYTLMGGVVAISNDPLINDDGSMGTKVPKKYIAVAQGFFVGTGSNAALSGNNPNLSSPVTGGTINFKNSQRAFKVESSGNSLFFKTNIQNQTVSEDVDIRQKIRLLYQSPSNIYRQILVGVDENATSFFDVGYDAPIIDENAADLYWKTADAKLTIQAVSNFSQEQILPLGLKTSTAGICTIKIDTMDNISEDTQLYIHDAETGIDYDIKNSDFTIALPIGVYNDRFSLRFTGSALGTSNPEETINPIIYFTNNNSVLNINTLENVKTVKLYNLLGQFISEHDVQNEATGTIQIPLLNIASGTYIVKIITQENTIFSNKILKK
jgi:hypothetical protein